MTVNLLGWLTGLMVKRVLLFSSDDVSEYVVKCASDEMCLNVLVKLWVVVR